MTKLPWWVRLALWVARARDEQQRPALPPPNPLVLEAEALEAETRRLNAERATVEERFARIRLANQLLQADQVMRHALTGSPWATPDARFRS